MEFILILPLHPTETGLIIIKWPNTGVIREKEERGKARRAGGVLVTAVATSKG